MPTCSEPLRVVPGPQGPAGTNGSNGTNGADAFTTLTANFTVPAIGGTAVATVGSTAWMVIGQPLFLQNGGVFYVTAIGGATSVTLQNPAAETGNVAAATVVATGNRVAPSGFKGAAGSGGSSGSGVSVTTKGDLQTHDGVTPTRLPVGTNGQMIRARSAAGNGIDWFTALPNATAATDDNKIAVANCPLGTEQPAPIQYQLAIVTDTGAYQTVGGNARGVDAVDQQPARAGATQVASGNNSTIAGGRNNTASGQGSVVGGGEGNVSSGADSTVGGGANNTASGQDAAVCAGNTNTASGLRSFVAAGFTNVASANASAVLSGIGNIASGQGSVASGESNTASATDSAVLGGIFNTASGDGAVVIGGFQGIASLFGQVAHASGQFAAQGDAQASELIYKVATTDATVGVEMFIGPASQRAAVPVGKSWAFQILLVARSSAGVDAAWKAEGLIHNNAGTTALVGGAITPTVIADGTGATWGVAGSFIITADNANDSLKLAVSGAALTLIRWVAVVRLSEVSYP